jgi:hypothetical protein
MDHGQPIGTKGSMISIQNEHLFKGATTKQAHGFWVP